MSAQAPPGSGPPYPPPYGGPMYMPFAYEQYLTKMRIWLANAAGLALIFLGYLFELSGSQDSNVLGFARFLVIVGGIGAATLSLGGALGSKRTTDMQNLGLLVWAGLLLWFTTTVLASIR
ncbi:MAG TPA: hypothetical protein VJ300_04800 [Thermoplasmata archaeon]|nr:hypothetical protein [Thermoplasmata archaeon]